MVAPMSEKNAMTPMEAFEMAAQVVEGHRFVVGEDMSPLAKKIRELGGKPFRLMEAAANIPLPERLKHDRIAKAANDIMRARGWHMEAFACAFWKQTGSWEGAKYRLVERREVSDQVVETSWRFERIPEEPAEANPAPAPAPECPT
jgi:hypothetical protein